MLISISHPISLILLQLLDLFDAEMSSSERLHAAEVMYTRCYNPLDFWETALPELSEMQVGLSFVFLLSLKITNDKCAHTVCL